LRSAAAAIRLEIALAEGELPRPDIPPHDDPIFRLQHHRWGLVEGELGALFPVRDPGLRIISFDTAELAQPKGKGRCSRKPSPRHLVAFAERPGERRDPFVASDTSIQILTLSDGTLTVQEIAARIGAPNSGASEPEGVRLIEELFVAGLLQLQAKSRSRTDHAAPGLRLAEVPVLGTFSQ
jgi:hypothetical protein